MSDAVENTNTTTKKRIKKADILTQSKRHEGKEEIRQRVPVSGNRSKLKVRNTDPSFQYRWVLAGGENDSRILDFLNGGYTFVEATSADVGESHVYQSENLGAIARVPAGDSLYLYLMRIPKELYEEDQRAKMQSIKNQESAITGERPEHGDSEGQYGKISIGRS